MSLKFSVLYLFLQITYIFADLGTFAYKEMQDTLEKDKEDAGARKAVAREGI